MKIRRTVHVKKPIITVILLLALILSLASCSQPAATQPAAADETEYESPTGLEQPIIGIKIGQIAPDFTLNLRGGGSVSLWDLRGTPVLLNVFTTWCPPCQAEFSDIQAIHEVYSGRAKVLGIDISESQTDVDAYFDRFDFDYAIAYDPAGEIDADYNIEFIPQTWIIDADGLIVEYKAGAGDFAYFSKVLDKAVD